MAAETPVHPQVQIQLEIDPHTAQGIYANMAVLNHNETEFVIDFIFVQPQAPKAVVRSRIITSPKHMKRLLLAMQDNLSKFEGKYGVIELADPEGPLH